MVRVRFAPSPTGFVHVGNARTAMVNKLYAVKNNGSYVLRMEDTDLAREVENAEQQIIQDLEWLGLVADEDPNKGGDFAPYRTNDRSANGDYDRALEKLFADGRAYECFVTKDELDLMRKIQTSQGLPPHYDNRHRDLTDAEKEAFRAEGKTPVIRFKLEDKAIEWNDLVRGEVRYEAKNLGGDPIIIRSNGVPIFAFAGAVDDVNQNITHVFRGEDHVTNTAIQVQIFEALGADVPVMAHMPMLAAEDGAKLSKRNLDDLSVRELKAAGYVPQAVTTYMCSLGFSALPEIGDVKALAEQFDVSKMGRSTVRIDMSSLRRMNAHALHAMTYAEVKPFLDGFLTADKSENELFTFWDAVKGNIELLSDLQEQYDICYGAVTSDIEDEDKGYIEAALSSLPAGPYTLDTWGAWVGELKTETGRKGKQLFMPLRIALTGQKHGPEMATLFSVIGEETARQRLTSAIGK